MTYDGYRPVEHHLVEFFKQNQAAKVTITEAMHGLHELGFKHWGVSVRDNLLILVERGFLVRNNGHFSMASDGANIDLASPTPKIQPQPRQQVR